MVFTGLLLILVTATRPDEESARVRDSILLCMLLCVVQVTVECWGCLNTATHVTSSLIANMPRRHRQAGCGDVQCHSALQQLTKLYKPAEVQADPAASRFQSRGCCVLGQQAPGASGRGSEGTHFASQGAGHWRRWASEVRANKACVCVVNRDGAPALARPPPALDQQARANEAYKGTKQPQRQFARLTA